MKSFTIVSPLVLLVASLGCFKMDVKLPKEVPAGVRVRRRDLPPLQGRRNFPAAAMPPPTTTATAAGGDLAGGIAGKLFADSEQGAVFTAYDTLGYRGRSTWWPAWWPRGTSSRSPVRPWGSTRTANCWAVPIPTPTATRASGHARNAGGYQFAARATAVPAAAPPEVGADHPLADPAVGPAAGAEMVIVDLDRTVVDSNFIRVLLGGGGPGRCPVPPPCSAGREKYTVVYLTIGRTSSPGGARVAEEQQLPAGAAAGLADERRVRRWAGQDGPAVGGGRTATPTWRSASGDKSRAPRRTSPARLTAYLIPPHKHTGRGHAGDGCADPKGLRARGD